MDLEDLFTLYGTDKGEYSPVYHALFKNIRERQLVLLEVGIGTLTPDANSSMVGWALPGYRPGGSLRAWRDYFPHAEIYGLDVQPDTQFQDERIHTFLCDSTAPHEVDSFLESRGGTGFDIVIDDGSHLGLDQLKTLRNLLPHLRTGGYYIIEDIPQDRALLALLAETAREVGRTTRVFVTEGRNFLVASK
jgi:hypothetical protein